VLSHCFVATSTTHGSPYAETVPGILEAYQRVWERVGTDPIIWCWTKTEGHLNVNSNEVRWELDVPNTDILALVDDYVWNRILKINCHPPRRLYYEWREKSLELFPHDASARERFLDDQHRLYFAEEPPTGDWWNHVFVDCTDGDSTSAIIRHPVKPEWVLSGRTRSQRMSRTRRN